MTAGRGRPPLFDETAQAEYLQLITDGTRVGEAADKLGISRRTPTALAARNPHFAEHLAAAKGHGRTARIPHGTPGGYNNHNCRCPHCRAAATEARTQHREAARTDTTAQIHPLPIPQPTTAATKLLMLADVS